jgi:hypothetical protein
MGVRREAERKEHNPAPSSFETRNRSTLDEDPMEGDEKATASNAHAKALALNLDASIYGSFAEIGAGQEVAQWFLRVGAASGTVAQTICAYDKAFSDDRYGKGTRYVSRERLLAMLEREHTLVSHELGETRGGTTRFFSFADTVAGRNFKGDNHQHGWVGIRFEADPRSAPNDILLHVELRDPTAAQQSESLGILGVNLIDAAFHHRGSSTEFLGSLFQGLSRKNLELDVIALSGPTFDVDARAWCVRALRQGMCHVVVFDRDGRPVEPSTVLRKRPLIVESGRFEAAAPFQVELLKSAQRQMGREFPSLKAPPTTLVAMVVDDAVEAETPDTELVKRVDRLVEVAAVAVTDFAQAYRLVEFLQRFTGEPIRLAVGVLTLAKLFVEDTNRALPGSLLERLGRLLTENVRLYVSPMPVEAVRADLDGGLATMFALPTSGPVTVEHLLPPPPMGELLRYVRAAGWLVPTDSA